MVQKRMTIKEYNKNIIKQYQDNAINLLDFETRFNKNLKGLNNYIKQFNNILSHFSYDKKSSYSKLKDVKKNNYQIK